jgi:hypothetical protein
MNEDARGITPADVTSMTLEQDGPGWLVTIEQGNGAAVKTFELTHMERAQLLVLLENSGVRHVSFVDFSRPSSLPELCTR